MLTFSIFRARLTLLTSLALSISVINLQAQRLPTTVVPTHYKLFIDPDIGQAEVHR